jgi:hypothetical protein
MHITKLLIIIEKIIIFSNFLIDKLIKVFNCHNIYKLYNR